jgi:hypothetical protein
MHRSNKLDQANVVAVFDSQDEADEALMGLRIAGFPDRQIGYLSRSMSGLVVDDLGWTYLWPGTIVGTLVGAALGLWVGWMAGTGQSTPIAPPMVPEASMPIVLLACALWGALFFGLFGASIGVCFHRGSTVHFGSELEPGRYVLTVDAGDRKDEAWAILRDYGARHPAPADRVEVPANLQPGMA